MRQVLIVDDHIAARKRMESIIQQAFDASVIQDVATLAQARMKIANNNFDLIVLDLGLPDGNGEDFIQEIKLRLPNAYVVVSTIHDESDRLLRALQNGAKGYLLKEQPEDFLVNEFKSIDQGKPPLAPTVTRRLLEFIRTQSNGNNATSMNVSQSLQDEGEKSNISELTDREREILSLLAKGFDRPEIAGMLDISKHTVATHISKIYHKLGIKNRSEAALTAKMHGLV